VSFGPLLQHRREHHHCSTYSHRLVCPHPSLRASASLSTETYAFHPTSRPPSVAASSIICVIQIGFLDNKTGQGVVSKRRLHLRAWSSLPLASFRLIGGLACRALDTSTYFICTPTSTTRRRRRRPSARVPAYRHHCLIAVLNAINNHLRVKIIPRSKRTAVAVDAIQPSFSSAHNAEESPACS
jgi:hypothetical protein